MFKTIFYSVGLTIAITVLVVKLAWGALLGAIGLAIVPVEQLASLKASSAMASKMKQRVKARKSKVTKRFAKRAGKRLGTAAAGAATIGTLAVIGTVSYIEVSDYCETLDEVHTDLVILGEAEGSFDDGACLAHAKSDVAAIARDLWDSVKDKSREKVDAAKSWFDGLFDENAEPGITAEADVKDEPSTAAEPDTI